MKRRKRRSCRKLAYRTKPEARAALNALKHTGVKRFYQCPHCQSGVWHLTSEDRK